MSPVARKRFASTPAWVGVVLSVLAMLFGAMNWQRNQDLSDIEKSIEAQYSQQLERDQRTQREIGELREDVRELRRILLNGGGR